MSTQESISIAEERASIHEIVGRACMQILEDCTKGCFRSRKFSESRKISVEICMVPVPWYWPGCAAFTYRVQAVLPGEKITNTLLLYRSVLLSLVEKSNITPIAAVSASFALCTSSMFAP